MWWSWISFNKFRGLLYIFFVNCLRTSAFNNSSHWHVSLFLFHIYLYIKRYRCCYICACVCIHAHASIIFIVLVLCQCFNLLLCAILKNWWFSFVFSSPRKIPLFNFEKKNTEKMEKICTNHLCCTYHQLFFSSKEI